MLYEVITHTKRLLAVYAQLSQYFRPKYNDNEKAFTFPWGSRLKLGYCNTEDDVLQYQGQECDVLFLDEATQLTEYQFGWLCACVRGTGAYPRITSYNVCYTKLLRESPRLWLHLLRKTGRTFITLTCAIISPTNHLRCSLMRKAPGESGLIQPAIRNNFV